MPKQKTPQSSLFYSLPFPCSIFLLGRWNHELEGSGSLLISGAGAAAALAQRRGTLGVSSCSKYIWFLNWDGDSAQTLGIGELEKGFKGKQVIYTLSCVSSLCVCAAKSFMFILWRKTCAINTSLTSSQQQEQGALGCSGQFGWRNMVGKGGLNGV